MGNHYSVIVAWSVMECETDSDHAARAKRIMWEVQGQEPRGYAFVNMLEAGNTAMECLLLFSMKDAAVFADRIWAALDTEDWERPEKLVVMYRGEHDNAYTIAKRGEGG